MYPSLLERGGICSSTFPEREKNKTKIFDKSIRKPKAIPSKADLVFTILLDLIFSKKDLGSFGLVHYGDNGN